MLKKTLLMLATTLGFSQVGESQQVKSGTVPPVTTSHLDVMRRDKKIIRIVVILTQDSQH